MTKEEKPSYYQKQGIKTYTTYTNAYHGSVKDYGFHGMIRSLRKQFPEFGIVTDTPLIGSKSLVIHKAGIKIYYSAFKRPIKLLALYGFDDHRWYFVDEKTDEYVNIKKLLKTLRQSNEKLLK